MRKSFALVAAVASLVLVGAGSASSAVAAADPSPVHTQVLATERCC